MADQQNAKDQAMELAESARETEWQFPSFTAEMFRGNFRWDLLHPYPKQDAEDQKVGNPVVVEVPVEVQVVVRQVREHGDGEAGAVDAVKVEGGRLLVRHGGVEVAVAFERVAAGSRAGMLVISESVTSNQ